MSDTTLLRQDYPGYSLAQVASRLSAISLALWQGPSGSPDLSEELQVAAMCCARAQSRLECVLDFLEHFRSQRDLMERWLDEEIERLDRDCGPREPEDLSPLRPDAAGSYGWDRWQARALAAGLSADLAGLGRAVMREAVQHDWDAELKAECGWLDGGQAMLERARRDGEGTARRWNHLLTTDGLRGYWTADGEWCSGPAPEDQA